MPKLGKLMARLSRVNNYAKAFSRVAIWSGRNGSPGDCWRVVRVKIPLSPPNQPPCLCTGKRCIPGSIANTREQPLGEGTAQHRLSDGTAREHKSRTKASIGPLAGKLFDEKGQPLYAQGAAKGKRRYRYYVSRELVRGSAEHAEGGWRIPAPEMQRVVVGAAKAFLDDRPARGDFGESKLIFEVSKPARVHTAGFFPILTLLLQST